MKQESIHLNVNTHYIQCLDSIVPYIISLDNVNLAELIYCQGKQLY